MPHKGSQNPKLPRDSYTCCQRHGKGKIVARGKHLTEYERETIRIGLAHGVPARQIAAFLGRTERVIYQHRDRMTADGTLHALPFPFLAEAMADAMRRHGQD